MIPYTYEIPDNTFEDLQCSVNAAPVTTYTTQCFIGSGTLAADEITDGAVGANQTGHWLRYDPTIRTVYGTPDVVA